MASDIYEHDLDDAGIAECNNLTLSLFVLPSATGCFSLTDRCVATMHSSLRENWQPNARITKWPRIERWDATVVARIIARSTRARPANALETPQFVDECRNDRIAVEEPDHKAYIIHLSNEPEINWLIVGSEALIFLELRHRHERWATEHPNWNGWIAF